MPYCDTSAAARALLAAALLVASGEARADAFSDAAAAATVSVQAVEPSGEGRAKVAECSGALIAPDLVLTSGHCLDGAAGPDRVAVFAYRGGRPIPQPILAAAIARHPEHVRNWRTAAGDPETRRREIAADLALIRLSRPVADAAPLGFGAEPGGAIAGTGASAPGGRSGVMKRSPLTGARAATGAGARVVFATAGSTVCGGDSGGPAVAPGTDGRPALWGVVAAVLKPRGGCGTRIAATPVDPGSFAFKAMLAAVGRP